MGLLSVIFHKFVTELWPLIDVISQHEKRYSGALVRFSDNSSGRRGLTFISFPADVHVHFTVKPVLSGHSKRRPKHGFQDQLSLNAGKKYCIMLQGEHSTILSTFIKLQFVFKIFDLSNFSGRISHVLLKEGIL